MAVKTLLSKKAQRDLDEIYRYLAQQAKTALPRIDTEIFKAFRRLATFPESGHWVREFSDKKYREVSVFHYRIIYRYLKKPHQIRILTIRHGRRLLPELSRKP